MQKLLNILLFLSILFSSKAQTYITDINELKNDSLICLQNISVYREYMKMNLMNKAVDNWKKVYTACPGLRKIIYQDGAKFLHQSIKNEQEKNKKKQLTDSLMHLYDKRIKYFGEKNYVQGKKGFDLYKFDKERTQEARFFLWQSVNSLKNQTSPAIINALMAATVALNVQNKLSDTLVFSTFLVCNKILKNQLEKEQNAKKRRLILIVQKSIAKTFTKSTAAKCTNIEATLQKRINKNQNKLQNLKDVYMLLKAANCIESDLFYRTAIKLDNIQATAQNAYLLAGIELNKNNNKQAVSYLEKAIRIEKSNNNKSKYYHDLAIVQYTRFNDYNKAKNSFINALKNAKNKAKIYYAMGDMYASYSSNFNKKDLAYSSLIWLATDYYLKAKQANKKLQKAVDDKIAYYRQFYPTSEDLFFFHLKAGQNYKIGGWINDTTKVRVR